MADTHREPSRQRRVRVFVAVLAAALVAFSAWSLLEYAQGADPLAWLSSQPALQTTQDVQDNANGNANGMADASNGGGASSQAGDSGGEGQSGASNESSSQEASGNASQDGGPSSDANNTSGSTKENASGTSNSKNGGATGGSQSSNEDGSRAGENGSGPSADSGSGQGAGTADQGASEAQPAAPADQPQAVQQQTISVSVTIDGTPAGGSSHGGVATLQAGANAYDALVAVDGNVNARGSTYGTYVAAIDGLAEKQHGSASGWLYSVNGVRANTACSNYRLSDGDVVTWTYWVGDELPS